MIISRSFRLVEHLFDLNTPQSGRNTPFNDISLRMSEDGCPDRREDRQLAGVNVSIPGKGQRENHRLVFVNVNESHAGIHGDDIWGNGLGVNYLASIR